MNDNEVPDFLRHSSLLSEAYLKLDREEKNRFHIFNILCSISDDNIDTSIKELDYRLNNIPMRFYSRVPSFLVDFFNPPKVYVHMDINSKISYGFIIVKVLIWVKKNSNLSEDTITKINNFMINIIPGYEKMMALYQIDDARMTLSFVFENKEEIIKSLDEFDEQYCDILHDIIKNDDLEQMNIIVFNPLLKYKLGQENYDCLLIGLLKLSIYFSSIRCFKRILLEQHHEIDPHTINYAISYNNCEMFHELINRYSLSYINLDSAVLCCRWDIAEYIICHISEEELKKSNYPDIMKNMFNYND